MKRKQATERVEQLLARVFGGEGQYLPRVSEVAVFGSYARGALEVHDVDLAIRFDLTEKEDQQWFIEEFSGYRSGRHHLRDELRGKQRVLSLHLNEEGLNGDNPDFQPFIVLWRRGDTIEQAIERLHGIEADPTAGRSEDRDHVFPEIDPVADKIARPDRGKLEHYRNLGLLAVELVDIPVGIAPTNKKTLKAFNPSGYWEQRWADNSPKRQAAERTAAFLEQHGIAPVRPDGAELVSDEQIPITGQQHVATIPRIAVHFGARRVGWSIYDFHQYRAGEVLVLLNPSTRTRPIQALWLRPARTWEELHAAMWGSAPAQDEPSAL